MNHHHTNKGLLAVYRDLAAPERQLIDEHVRTCPACATRLAELQQVDARLADLEPAHLPAGLARPFNPRQGEVGAPRLAFVRSFASAVAVMAVIAGVWLGVTSMNTSRSQATATPTMTLTPTATLIASDAPPAGDVLGARTSVSFVPPPAPVPSPASATPGEARAMTFLAALSPRATIVR